MTDAKPADVNRILVYLRIRPAKKGDPAKGIPPEICESEGTYELFDLQPDNKTAILTEGGKSYTYDWIFNGPDVKQEDIFDKITRPVVDNVFKGFWGTTMCYGQTGSGKSFTLMNFDKRNEGVVPRAMRHMFETVRADTERKYQIKFSFIQIYCDRLQDLFNPTCKDELKLNRDKDGVFFPGIVEQEVATEDEFRQKYEDGNQYRVITATKMNPESSRGHAALFIQVNSEPRDDPTGEKRKGKLFLIDLAGYEKFASAASEGGIRKEEARTINASLLSLGNVIQNLSEGSEHIPWRNAKLTRMLEDAIGGKAKCSIILTASPSSQWLHETMGTLYFGSRAMAVKTNAKVAVNIDYQKLAKKLQEMLNAAESKINTLEIEATRRQLEREQTESRMQREWANLKARQDEQLKKLLTTGATPDQIQELINSNQMESEILEEQHYEERKNMEERHEESIQEEAKLRAQMLEQEGERVQQTASGDVNKLQRELAHTKQELEKYRQLSRDAEAEARRLSSELAEAKITLVSNGIDASAFNSDIAESPAAAIVASSGKAGASSTSAPGGAGAAPGLTASKSISLANLSDPEAKKIMDQRIAQVRAMLEEQHAAKLAEHLDPLQEELTRYKQLYESLRASVDEELQVQKDTLTQMYEEEIREMRETSNDIQEKLKKNHMTIKKSYQKQKEELQDENEQLMAQVARLTEQVQGGGGGGGAAPPPNAPGAPKPVSLAEMMIAKKKAEGLAEDLRQQIQDMKTEMEYSNTEKQALERQLREYEPKPGEERLKPAAVRKLRQDFDKLKSDKENLEKDLFKLKAAQALSGPQDLLAGNSDNKIGTNNFDDDIEGGGGNGGGAPSNAALLEQKEDMCGDFEGTKVFVDKMLKFPYFSGAQKVANGHPAILGSLTTDLDEFRRILRLRFYFLGNAGSGKSAALKCLTAASTPLIRSCPETIPTLHPLPTNFFVEDITTSKNDLYKRYIKFEEIPDDDGQSKAGFMSVMSGLASVVGLGGSNAVSDPSRIYIETLDFPGNQAFFRGFPPYLLPSKNAMYIITYNMTQPVAVIAEDIGVQLRNIHAAVHRDYNPALGGDGPRVAVCLLGTHRDAMRDTRDAAVVAFLNKVTIAIGNEFYKLRNDKAYGLQVVGNFGTSARDWTVISAKQNAPNNWRDLCAYLATFGQKLYENNPSSFLPAKKNTAAFSSYMIGDDNITIQGEKTQSMDPLEQRMRKGIITFLTALHREQKVRWLMGDKEMRTLIAEHLEVDEKTAVGNNVVNYVIREIRVRNIISVLPSHIYEPKYLPVTGHEQVLPRDGLIVLDPTRLLAFYSVFIGGQWIPKIPAQLYKEIITREQKESKNPPMFDLAALKQTMGPLSKGVMTQECAQILLNRFIPMVGSDPRLLFEFLCVMGLGTGLRGENAMLCPAHFNVSMPPLLTGYISFLVTNYGDGLGRKYQLTAAPDSFFARLQTMLVPFGNAPIKDADALNMNFKDGCFLILEKSRLKWGTYGSKALKDAIVNINVPVRGIIKLEGNNLYVACTGRSTNSQHSMNAVRTLIEGIHHQILALCRREFRGVSATFQEMQLTGVEGKRERLAEGIKSYVEAMGGGSSTVQEQTAHVGNMNDPSGKEIDNALKALPQWMYVE